ncbi:hypothetical protein DD237_008138 [Peronospora effusa]|uniref:RxLR effector PexRD54 WY domain-containing protein n=1 Tax=Peronospora effusa TaxID=542832 RepID=A0A3R7YSK3_9STRA|nr:hypothetical protein DD237_008138 [Peronospora effusa]
MSSAAQISCVLVVVTLIICSATTLAAPKSTPAVVALDTKHLSHAPVVIKRRLRRTTAMKTTETSEERALTFNFSGLAPNFTKLKSITAAFYHKIQSWVWRLTRKSSDEVFELLKLNKVVKLDTEGATLFEDPRFMKWVTFVKASYSKDPTAATEAMLKTLANHYSDGAALNKLLVAGTETNGMKAKRWKRSYRFQSCIRQKAILSKTHCFGSFSHLSRKHPKDHIAVTLTAFQEFYKDDTAWSKLLVAGTETKGVKSIADLAANLQAAQLKKWDNEGKTVEEVLQILELHTTKGNPFQDPLFWQFFAFVKLKHPKDHIAVTLTAFREFYKDDAAWAQLLVAGMKTDSVKSISTNLLWSQLSRWTEGGKTVGELFTLVGLEKIGEGLFKSPLFMQWVTFVEVRHRGNPKAANDIIWSTLAAHYGEDAAMADVLVAGTKIPNMSNFAVNLLKIQFDRWYNTGKSVEWLFTVLKLEKIGEELFESPRLFMWLVFVGARYEAGDNEAYKLAKKAAKKLADAAAEKPADAAAKKLADEAAKEAKDAFESANMASLEAALSTLRRHYEDDMLWKILAKGSEVNGQEVNIIAVELEEMLLRKLTTGRYKQSFHAFGA